MLRIFAAIFLLASAVAHAQQISNAGPSAAVSFVQQINIRNLGAVGNGVADDSAALAAAVNASNALISAGKQACIYAPAGIYLIKTVPPTFAGNGCVLGDGRNQTYFQLDATFTGALFTWDDAWLGTNYQYQNTTLNIGTQRAGPHVEGIAIVGTQAAGGEQDGFLFLDRADYVVFRDIATFYLPGKAFFIGQTHNVTQAYMRESKFYDMLIWACGTASLPAMEISSVGSGDASNTIEFHGLDVVGSIGQGLVLRNQASTGHVRLIEFFGLRIEGNGKDGLVIGDTVYTGIVDEIHIHGFRGNNSTNGFATILTQADAAADQPFNIYVDGTIDSGAGNGLVINAGRNLWFNLTNISVSGTGVTVGASPLVGSNILLNGNGAERGWTKSVDSTSVNSLVYATSAMSQTNTNNAAQSFIGGGQGHTVSGFQAGLIAGFNNTISGNFSGSVGGRRIVDRGRFALFCHGTNMFAVQGDQQWCSTELAGSGSSASAIRLTADGSAASGTNCINLTADGMVQESTHTLTIRDVTTSDLAVYTLRGTALKRGSGAATTALAANTVPAWTLTAANTATSAGWSLPTFTADTTNACMNVSWTPPGANTDTMHIVDHVEVVEVQ